MGNLLILDLREHVREGGSVAAAHASGAPAFALPGDDVAIFIGTDFDVGEAGRAVAADHQFHVAIEVEFDGGTAGGLGKVGADDAPAIGCEFAAEAAADMVHFNVNFCCRHSDILRQIARDDGDGLGGGPIVDLAIGPPFDGLAVRFETAMGEDRNFVISVDYSRGGFESGVGIAGDLVA